MRWRKRSNTSLPQQRAGKSFGWEEEDENTDNLRTVCTKMQQGPDGSIQQVLANQQEKLVGAVGIEFSVNPISPADSVAFALFAPPKMQLDDRVLWPRCGQLPKARSP